MSMEEEKARQEKLAADQKKEEQPSESAAMDEDAMLAQAIAMSGGKNVCTMIYRTLCF
jgi:hypothetical protein